MNKYKTNEELILQYKNVNSPKLLFFSSFIFITNIITTIYKGNYLYSFLFTCLTTTSLIVHYSNDELIKGINIADKISILMVVLYGSFTLQKNTYDDYPSLSKLGAIIITFLCVIWLFFYGYYTKQYCFDPNIYNAQYYHCIMHCMGSLGHHFIVFL